MWTAIEIPIRRDDATNYLSSMKNPNYSGNASKEEMVETKLMVATKSVIAKLRYCHFQSIAALIKL